MSPPLDGGEGEAYKTVLKGKGLELKKGPHKKTDATPAKVSKSEVTKAKDGRPPVVLRKSKTKAELAFERVQEERARRELAKSSSQKTHKQRVAEFNEKLSKLSEHYDIPKVGPG